MFFRQTKLGVDSSRQAGRFSL